MTEETIGIGSRLGGFQIESELGRGGMGVVYKAHELSLNRKVAIKVLSQRLCSDEEFIQRFKREAQVIAAMKSSQYRECPHLRRGEGLLLLRHGVRAGQGFERDHEGKGDHAARRGPRYHRAGRQRPR